MSNELVKDWFADRFSDLHPLLQKLHVEGGMLRGKVDLYYGSGVSGILGRRVARKMKLPGPGSHELSVTISHDDEYLHWNRSFNSQQSVRLFHVQKVRFQGGFQPAHYNSPQQRACHVVSC